MTRTTISFTREGRADPKSRQTPRLQRSQFVREAALMRATMAADDNPTRCARSPRNSGDRRSGIRAGGEGAESGRGRGRAQAVMLKRHDCDRLHATARRIARLTAIGLRRQSEPWCGSCNLSADVEPSASDGVARTRWLRRAWSRRRERRAGIRGRDPMAGGVRCRVFWIAVALVAAGALSACGQSSSTSSAPQPESASSGAGAALAAASHSGAAGAHRRRATHRRAHRRHTSAKRQRAPLRPGHSRCRARARASSSLSPRLAPATPAVPACTQLPTLVRTPGALNPAVTQSTIDRTICMSGYTETVRPSESITEKEKAANLPPTVTVALWAITSMTTSFRLSSAAQSTIRATYGPSRARRQTRRTRSRTCFTGWSATVRYGSQRRSGPSPPAGWRGQRATATAARRSDRARRRHPLRPPVTASAAGPNKPVSDVNCSDFSTHTAAQHWFEQHGGSPSNDVAGLDGDHDGLACQSLR